MTRLIDVDNALVVGGAIIVALVLVTLGDARDELRARPRCETYGECSGCGRARRLEAHHPARHSADREFVMGACRSCHRTITRWQDAIGMPVHRTEPSEAEQMRAGLVGMLHVAQLRQYRDADTQDPDFHLPRMLARMLAAMADDELMTWTPNPSIQLTAPERIKVTWR